MSSFIWRTKDLDFDAECGRYRRAFSIYDSPTVCNDTMMCVEGVLAATNGNGDIYSHVSNGKPRRLRSLFMRTWREVHPMRNKLTCLSSSPCVLVGWRCCLEEHVVHNHICGERHDCDTEAREHLAKHCALLEDWVFPPSFPLGPGVTENRWSWRSVCHLIEWYYGSERQEEI